MINQQRIKYLIAIIAGFLLAILLLDGCDSFKTQKSGVTTKIDTVYQVKKDTIKLTDYKPKLKYIYRTKFDTIEIFQDSLKFWHYKYDSIHNHKKGKTHLIINGWGAIDNININTTTKDSTIIITKEKTIRVEDKTSKIFFGPTYNSQKDIGLQADWLIRNKVIISTNAQYNDVTKAPAVGIGIKLRIK